MKQLPRCYAVLWVFSLLLLSARLSAQAGLLEKVENMALVDRVKPLETTEFVEKYVIYFSQPLDHRHPKKGFVSSTCYCGTRRIRPSYGDRYRGIWSRLCHASGLS